MRYVLILIVLIGSAISVSAQLTTPYTPRTTQALTALRNRAIQDGYTNPQISGIATMKGNFPVGSFTINNSFDLGSETGNDNDRGKSEFWGYLVRSTAKPDSLKAYVVVQVPILGFQVFDAPAGIDLNSLPGDFSQNLPSNSNGTPAWMNTDSLVLRLRTNSTFQQYRQQRPDASPDYVALGLSKLPTPMFSAGSPLWSVTFTGSSTAEFLSCSVHALDGRVECISGATSVEEFPFKNSLALMPNPARNSVSISIPLEVYSPDAKIEIFNTLGTKLFTFPMSGVGPDHAIVLPVVNYPTGMYFIRCTSGAKILTEALIIE
ncbi:MAG TPA: T9SS type A sorting domain-containing protein [Patescibacteria group bacterium]|nr:T9SS type A sorting domain-containing protein [Patescibacteria group bacterium]